MANHMEPEQFFCPTFTSYTDDKSAETAVRVAKSAYLEDDNLNFQFDFSFDDVSFTKDGHLFPVFKLDNLLDDKGLFCDVEESVSSMSSDGEEMYCVWRPRKAKVSPDQCKKSKSGGTGSKRWKILDLLKRSNSDGKGDFVFLTSKKKKNISSSKVSAVEEFYVRSRVLKEGQRRESYLPYKKDLVGFFC